MDVQDNLNERIRYNEVLRRTLMRVGGSVYGEYIMSVVMNNMRMNILSDIIRIGVLGIWGARKNICRFEVLLRLGSI